MTKTYGELAADAALFNQVASYASDWDAHEIAELDRIQKAIERQASGMDGSMSYADMFNYLSTQYPPENLQ